MPLDDFFTFQLTESGPGFAKARVTINAQHPLYKGHFPEQPVTPGVVLVEIIRQVLSSVVNKQLMMDSAKELKFMAPVIPSVVSQVNLNIEYSETNCKISANCIIADEVRTFVKLKGEFCE
jgi:3-hydroxyacyl-[acyl-carrier-protein] dehydratase